ncbi:MAG: ABC transporter permease [Actinomycetaceae bacterium]|nr:ABC transporter permease [Actinomycetaceae bacterium]
MTASMYWTAIFGQVRAYRKRFLRDKVALFFTFGFPLIFLFIFGSIFREQNISLDVAIINHSTHPVAQQLVERAENGDIDVLNVTDVEDMDDAREKLRRSEINGIIELPASFGEPDGSGTPTGTINILYAKGSDQAGSALTALATQTTETINERLGQPEAPIKVSSRAVGDEALTSFDYMFTGILGFTLLSMGIYGLANSMPAEKKRGSYRRLRAAPFTPSQLIIATSIHYVLVALLAMALMIVVGLTVFDFHMRGSWLLLAMFVTLGSFVLVGFGLMIGGWAKNENQSGMLTNIVAIPLMFLSGVFFPTFMFPDWLQTISQFMPITPIIEGLRLIMTEHAGIGDIATQIGFVTAWIAIVYFAATKLFRWE